MATVITRSLDTNCIKNEIPKEVMRLFPYRLQNELSSVAANCGIEEIRLRAERCASVTVPHGNLRLNTAVTRLELENILQEICDGSLYAHSDTIGEGYVTMPCGVRVGICGRAAVENGKIIGVYAISTMNFRIPAPVFRVGEKICKLFLAGRERGGILIYSPPGVGKTTLLKNIAAQLSSMSEPLRVSVIDTRGEIAPALSSREMCVDILAAYPKAQGIAIAARTLNAQAVICDEIGGTDEAEAIAAAQNCGVPFVATAHSANIESLLRRMPIAVLHEARVFTSYVGIERGVGGNYRYTVHTWEEADDIYKTYRRALARS